MDYAIKAEGLGKKYQIIQREARYETLRESLTGGLGALFRGRRPRKEAAVEEFWALRDVSFEVKPGDRLAVIGSNGSGKSTLLKILSRITEPSEGSGRVRGRLASLLEVGTGFHPELTGMENIFLNGAILGMSRAETRSKLDAIVDFAGVERFLDTPVKRYSSGMYTRLAFSVAAHLEPDILLVDEVLAVGDAEFQKKCMGKMREAGNEGRTLLFVSHNIGAVTSLCDRGILLDGGRVAAEGSAMDVARAYLSGLSGGVRLGERQFQGSLKGRVSFHSLEMLVDGREVSIVEPDQELVLRVRGALSEDMPSFRCNLSIYKEGARIFTIHDDPGFGPRAKGPFQSEYRVPARFLRPGEHHVATGAHGRVDNGEWIYGWDVASFTVMEVWGDGYDRFNDGLVNVQQHGTRT
jgi:lipopolysaccharide transport system ATP-binding protein